jgi:hypothetical protein
MPTDIFNNWIIVLTTHVAFVLLELGVEQCYGEELFYTLENVSTPDLYPLDAISTH